MGVDIIDNNGELYMWDTHMLPTRKMIEDLESGLLKNIASIREELAMVESHLNVHVVNHGKQLEKINK